MTNAPTPDLPGIFRYISRALEDHQQALNQADETNHDHGDHMVAIFAIAAEAAEAQPETGLTGAMAYAADLLSKQTENGSAEVYAQGLAKLAGQLSQREIDLEDLLLFVRKNVEKKENTDAPGNDEAEQTIEARSGDVLKALLAALAEWERVGTSTVEIVQPGTSAPEKPGGGPDLGYLFGVGMAYMRAKQKGGDRLDVLAETAVLASPLCRVPYRHQSGVIAVRALLQALGGELNKI